MKQIIFILFLATFIITGCKKDKPNNGGCAIPDVLLFEPYTMPVWHPNAQLIGFNHSPLTGISENGSGSCVWYMNSIKSDSTGFYTINKDGTGIKRCTNFILNSPAWSPDGNWIAFSLPPHIYKMRFDGNNFDTAHIIQLTDSAANFFPCWSPNSDTIYYDSNKDAPQGTSFYSIWRMSIEGFGKERITQSAGIGDTRQPFVGTNNIIYYVGYAQSRPEIFAINKDGNNKVQITFNGKGNRHSPKYYQNKIYFSDAGIYSTALTNYAPIKICNGGSAAYGGPYDISANGEIVYETFEYGIKDRRVGTLWIINADGTNNRQLTFNNF